MAADNDSGFVVVKGRKAARKNNVRKYLNKNVSDSPKSPFSGSIESILHQIRVCREDLQKSDYLKLVLETLGKAWVVFNGCPERSANEEADTISSALAAEADVSQGSQTGEVQVNTPTERGCKDSCHDTDKVTQCHGCCSDSDTDISQGSDTMKELVCYGIGNFATSLIARYQLALFLIFRDELKVPAEDTYIYDPLLMSIEMSTLEELGCQQMALNEEGKRRVNVPTMFYMPHCGKALYNNLLWANWQPELLSLLTIVGNSFQHMLDSTPRRTLATEAAYVMEIQPYSTEFRLMNTFKHGDIFNNTSVHVFTHNALATAPLDLWTHSAEPSYDDMVEIIRN
ncbi:SRR1-like protein [Lamellibrachia satsuma]|nr:SRR1-like protein [Lamellibrachia satsuma]